MYDKWEYDWSFYFSNCSISAPIAASSSLGDPVPAHWEKAALPNFGYKVVCPLLVLYLIIGVVYALTVTMYLPGHHTDQLLHGVQGGRELVQTHHEDQLDQQNWAHTKPVALEGLSMVKLHVAHQTPKKTSVRLNPI